VPSSISDICIMDTPGFEPLGDDPYKDAGVLGVYSSYYESSKEDFNRLRRSSPLKSPKPSDGLHTLYRASTPTPQRFRTDLLGGSTHGERVKEGSSPLKNYTSPAKSSSISTNPGHSHTFTSSYVHNDWLEILRRCLNDLTGRDKAAKMLIYLLRLVLSEAPRGAVYSSKADISATSYAKAPIVFVRRVALLAFSQLFSRSNGSISGLIMYRQLLRAGSAPVQVIKLFRLLQKSLTLLIRHKNAARENLAEVSRLWLNWSTITSLCSLYYAWFDESLLLFNIGVIHSSELKAYHRLSSRHKFLAWYAKILLGLRNSYAKYNELNNRETSARIDFEVKERAKKLLSRTNGFQFESQEVYSQRFLDVMREVKYQKRALKLDMARLSCDLVYDSVLVFNQPLYKPLHLAFGLASGSLGFYKVWLEKGREMDEKDESR